MQSANLTTTLRANPALPSTMTLRWQGADEGGEDPHGQQDHENGYQPSLRQGLAPWVSGMVSPYGVCNRLSACLLVLCVATGLLVSGPEITTRHLRHSPLKVVCLGCRSLHWKQTRVTWILTAALAVL